MKAAYDPRIYWAVVLMTVCEEPHNFIRKTVSRFSPRVGNRAHSAFVPAKVARGTGGARTRPFPIGGKQFEKEGEKQRSECLGCTDLHTGRLNQE